MKKLLFVWIAMLATAPVFSQKEKPTPPEMPRSDENNQVYYMEVVSMDGVDKMELFKRTRNWVKSYYKNPTAFTEEMDSVNGKIVMKPQFATYRILKNDVKAQSAIVRYTLVVSLKDGKFRYEIKDLNLKEASYFPIEKLFNEKDPNMEDNYNTLKEANETILDLINNLKESMKEPSTKVKKDEW